MKIKNSNFTSGYLIVDNDFHPFKGVKPYFSELVHYLIYFFEFMTLIQIPPEIIKIKPLVWIIHDHLVQLPYIVFHQAGDDLFPFGKVSRVIAYHRLRSEKVVML